MAKNQNEQESPHTSQQHRAGPNKTATRRSWIPQNTQNSTQMEAQKERRKRRDMLWNLFRQVVPSTIFALAVGLRFQRIAPCSPCALPLFIS
jgi:hypothetical protein